MHFFVYYPIYSERYRLLRFQSLDSEEPYFANRLPFSYLGTFSTASTVRIDVAGGGKVEASVHRAAALSELNIHCHRFGEVKGLLGDYANWLG